MRTRDFYYDLPRELIAQTPAEVRSESRLLVYDRRDGSISHRRFADIVEYINAGDVLVRNTTRVIPARLFGRRADTGGKLEFLLLKRLHGDVWESLVKPGRSAKKGLKFEITPELRATIGDTTESGGRLIELEYDGVFEEVLERAGETPLPPYITARLDVGARERYQTVYAEQNGSVAAPTAGLHFTPELFAALEAKGVEIADVLLHVGLGTFRPVTAERIEEHRMHSEYYNVSEDAARRINAARAAGGRIIAVGTTSCRTLESVADEHGAVHSGEGETGIFISPGYRFKAVDGLITNFHLPESTLLMLVSALAGREEMLRAYSVAVEERYRFFSFGDAMLIV
ncbi:MAG: tRNA preQ1(34) S-adenosylmethionine ribosyltransferase-isomerase QueA [Clostridia bacterium]|nr:tRNA preQ1(34) S-adenosylmethionine ribosyltransferase-isomerase QueA [Clostridia bacterium]